jgi:ketosteroid isomerase-like protein
MSQENVETVREAAAKFARTGEFGSLLAADAVVVNAPGSPFSVKGSGPTAIREWVQEIDEAFEEWQFRPDKVLDAPGDKVVMLSRAWGRGRGKGVEIDMELNVVYTLADGQITRIEGFLTRREALEAAGLRE